jgi:hypothetical protein
MARGWESKDVESRIQDAQDRPPGKGTTLTPEQQALNTKIHLLEQQQRRLITEMRDATTDRMLALLRREMAWVEDRIKELQ